MLTEAVCAVQVIVYYVYVVVDQILLLRRITLEQPVIVRSLLRRTCSISTCRRPGIVWRICCIVVSTIGFRIIRVTLFRILNSLFSTHNKACICIWLGVTVLVLVVSPVVVLLCEGIGGSSRFCLL